MDKVYYTWSEEKNKLLKEIRGISFEKVLLAIENEQIIDIIDNPSSNHKDQKCYVLEICDYVYLVPFVKKDNEIFLKTIFPSRKHKKFYIERRSDCER